MRSTGSGPKITMVQRPKRKRLHRTEQTAVTRLALLERWRATGLKSCHYRSAPKLHEWPELFRLRQADLSSSILSSASLVIFTLSVQANRTGPQHSLLPSPLQFPALRAMKLPKAGILVFP